MAQHRYRQNKIKREHTIIDGILPALERIAALSDVHAITPGRINQRAGNRSNDVTFQYRTETGLKFLARSSRAVQEVFVVTDTPDAVLEALVAQGVVVVDRNPSEERADTPAQSTSQAPTQAQSESKPKPRRRSRSRSKPKKTAKPTETSGTAAKSDIPGGADRADTSQEGAPQEGAPPTSPPPPPRPPSEQSGRAGESGGSTGSVASDEPGQSSETGGSSEAGEAAPPPKRGRAPAVEDALPDDIREQMQNLIQGKPISRPENERRATRNHARGGARRPDAKEPEKQDPGITWRDIEADYQELMRLERQVDRKEV